MQAEWIYNGVEFKVGDRVKVVSDAPTADPNGMGVGIEWENSWVHAEYLFGAAYPHMDGYIGLEFVIEDIDETGVIFEDGDGCVSYAFPLSCMINLSQRASLPVIGGQTAIQQKEAA